jgi:hypothetical protein
MIPIDDREVPLVDLMFGNRLQCFFDQANGRLQLPFNTLVISLRLRGTSDREDKFSVFRDSRLAQNAAIQGPPDLFARAFIAPAHHVPKSREDKFRDRKSLAVGLIRLGVPLKVFRPVFRPACQTLLNFVLDTRMRGIAGVAAAGAPRNRRLRRKTIVRMVPKVGIEPTLLSEQDFESSASILSGYGYRYGVESKPALKLLFWGSRGPGLPSLNRVVGLEPSGMAFRAVWRLGSDPGAQRCCGSSWALSGAPNGRRGLQLDRNPQCFSH